MEDFVKKRSFGFVFLISIFGCLHDSVIKYNYINIVLYIGRRARNANKGEITSWGVAVLAL